MSLLYNNNKLYKVSTESDYHCSQSTYSETFEASKIDLEVVSYILRGCYSLNLEYKTAELLKGYM